MRRRREGMTLIEVMLAVVILGVSLAALAGAASQAMGVVRQARNYEMARRLLGQVEVEKPLRLEDEIQAGQDSGTFTDGPEGWSWTRLVEDIGETEGDEQKDGLFRVTTTVHWARGGKKSSEETVRLLFVPEDNNGKRTLKPDTL